MPSPKNRTARISEALRLARRSWQLLHTDSGRAIALADTALARAGKDVVAEAWARLARGYHLLHFSTPDEATRELTQAQQCFDAVSDRAGHVLAGAGLARALWRTGEFSASLEKVLSLRDEGLRVLKHRGRGVLLNTIAGCYSAQGDSEQAFAYMYEALRDAPPARGHGYDAVLHCNLSNELLQLGDYNEALRHVDYGIERCAGLNNPRVLSVLRINRIICLTDLDRAREALPDVKRVRDVPADASGRGAIAPHFETLAVAALRAGEVALGAELVDQAAQIKRLPIPDEHVELAISQALLAHARGDTASGIGHMRRAQPLVDDGVTKGLSLRMQCLFYSVMSELLEKDGEAAGALAATRTWQRLHVERAQLASRARYQAAALQTELLRLQHQLEDNDAKRRTIERARAELETTNQQLSQRIEQVQSLEQALREQATRDELTGLFNRRHLNQTLPTLWALAKRERQPLAVAIIDLDHFKAVNDQHGHGTGDTLLASFGKLLVASLRKSDVACRYGGEEFCVLMPQTDAAAAQLKVQGLLAQWRDTVFQTDGATLSGMSFSAGVSDSFLAPQSVERLLISADDELLVAKRRGRSRVRVAAGHHGDLGHFAGAPNGVNEKP